LCHFNQLHAIGSCRICSVEVAGAKGLMAACVTPVTEGMVVMTHSAQVRQMRKILYELMLSDHPTDCLHCDRNGRCEFQDLGEVLQIKESRFAGNRSKNAIDDSSPAIIRDTTKCILCRRCVSMCNEVQGVGALNAQNRGFSTEIGPGGRERLGTAVCTFCGQCTTVCPVDALHEKDSITPVWQALSNPTRKTIVQTAPAVRAALGEGIRPGSGDAGHGEDGQRIAATGLSGCFRYQLHG